MKKINFGARETDLENIRVIMALYPNPQNITQAIRLALAGYIRHADQVQVEQARKAMLKRDRAVGVAILQARNQARKASREATK